METLGQLFGATSQVAPDVPVAAGQPTSTTAGALFRKIPSTDDMQGLLKTLTTLKSMVPAPAPPMSVPTLQRRPGGGIPAPSALQFLKAIQGSQATDPKTAALLRALSQFQAP